MGVDSVVFALDPPPAGVLVTPLPLELPYFSYLVEYPMEKVSPSKMLLHYTTLRKIIFSSDEEKKIILLMLIQRLIISGLSQLIINGKSLRNMEAIRYSTQKNQLHSH